ncbi:hypothetical protein PSYPI_40769, partial [Pseudomonas syringae pv. pisi str. 1704B]
NGLKSGETVQKASSKATRRLIVLTSCKILRKETHHDIHQFKAWTT